MVLGRDQVGLLCVYVLAGYVVWHVAAARKPLAALRASILPLAAGVAGGLVVAAVPMIMTALLAGQTSRASIIDLAGAERGSLHPASLLTAFVANLYGTDGPLADFWGQPSFAWGPTDLFLARNMSDVYMGAIPLIALLALGVARGALAAREVRFFVAALLVMTIYALGRYTPAFALMFHLPGVGLFRRPADATFLMGDARRHSRRLFGPPADHRNPANPGEPARSWAPPSSRAGLAASVGVAWWKGRLGQALPPLAIASACIAVSAAALWAAARFGKARPLLVAAAPGGGPHRGPRCQ